MKEKQLFVVEFNADFEHISNILDPFIMRIYCGAKLPLQRALWLYLLDEQKKEGVFLLDEVNERIAHFLGGAPFEPRERFTQELDPEIFQELAKNTLRILQIVKFSRFGEYHEGFSYYARKFWNEADDDTRTHIWSAIVDEYGNGSIPVIKPEKTWRGDLSEVFTEMLHGQLSD